ENEPHRASDQYSLALVYQELLTGTHPFGSLTPVRLTTPSLRGQPDLGPLPATDRPAVTRALDPDPARRFPDCVAFVDALIAAGLSSAEVPALRPDAALRPRVNLVRPGEILRQLVRLATEGVEVRDVGDLRLFVRRGPIVEHSFQTSVP